MNASFAIAAALPADLPDIDVLLDAGFGPARRNRTAYRLRSGLSPDPALSFVARVGDRLVGSVQCWNIRLRTDSQVLPLVLLGPVATAADCRGQGIASALVHTALAVADTATDSAAVLLIGDAPFYGRFGFSADRTGGWMLPGPVARERLLLRGGAELPALGVVEPAEPVRRAA